MSNLQMDMADDEIEVRVGALRPDEAAVLNFLKAARPEAEPAKVIQGPWPGLAAARR